MDWRSGSGGWGGLDLGEEVRWRLCLSIYIPSRARGRAWIPIREMRQAGRIGHLGLFMGIYMGSL